MSRIVCDDSACIGCLCCVISCIDHHYKETEIKAVPLRRYKKVMLASGLSQYITESCRHCVRAPCAAACREKAVYKDEFGFVQVNTELCNGCRSCEVACPFGIPSFNEAGHMVKCDGCCGNVPACVLACPRGALSLK